MKIQCDSLKYVTLLESKGISHKSAKACFEVLTDMEIINIYSVNEVNSMLNEAINKVFEDRDKEFEQRDKMLEQRDLRLAEQKREFDENLRLQRQEMLESRKELRQEILSSRRWLMGTMLTIGLSLAAYLTTLVKMIH